MAGRKNDNPQPRNPNDSDYVSKHSKLGNPNGTGQNYSSETPLNDAAVHNKSASDEADLSDELTSDNSNASKR